MAKITVITPSIRKEGLEITRHCLGKQTFKDFDWIVEMGDGITHDLNASYNRALRKASGDLIVSLQDYTQISDNGLELFWKAYQENPNFFFTAPVGKCKTTEYKDPEYDWRMYKTGEEVNYRECEMDWGAFPLDIAKEIGGFDEELDKFWSSDNVNFCYRAHLREVKFKVIDIPAHAFDHDYHAKHPFRDNFNPRFNDDRMELFRKGEKLSL